MSKRRAASRRPAGREPGRRALLWLLSCGVVGCTLQAADGGTLLAAPLAGPEAQAGGAVVIDVASHCVLTRTPSGYLVDCPEPADVPTSGTTVAAAPSGSDGSDAGSDGSDAGSDGSDGSDAGSDGVEGPLGAAEASSPGPDEEQDPHDISVDWSGADPATGLVVRPQAVATDACDESPFADASWERRPGTRVSVNALVGTSAWEGSELLLSRYELLYEQIRSTLGVAETPEVEIFLSPSRVAARQHGKRTGIAYPKTGVIEALHVGSPDEYENLHPGYLLTRILAPNLVDAGAGEYILPVLARGLGELMDHSSRDLHLAYAYELVTANENQSSIARLSELDLEGQAPGSAGSLVQHLVEAFGMPRFRDILQASAVTWQSGAYYHETVGSLDDGSDLEAVLADALDTVADASWTVTRDEWQSKLVSVLSQSLPEVAEPDRADLANLVALADLALNSDDSAAYRSTMEGFYCVGWSEQDRLAKAEAMVTSYGRATTRILKIYPTATRHFRSARILATRSFGDGNATTTFYDAEKFPGGWRFTWAAEW